MRADQKASANFAFMKPLTKPQEAEQEREKYME